MAKPPPNLPQVGDKARLRGRPSFTGIVTFINPINNWTRIDWDNLQYSGPGICHLYELEKIDD